MLEKVEMMENINYVTILLLLIFLFPILIGITEPFSQHRIKYSLISLFDNMEFLFAIFLSIYLTKRIFFEHGNDIFKKLFELIPQDIIYALKGKDILTYITAGPVILLLVLLILRIFTTPLYRYIIGPMSEGFGAFIERRNIAFKRIFSGLWQLPRSIYLVFIVALGLNFYSYYFPNPELSKWMNDSTAYQAVYRNALYPVLNSNLAKKIPVIVNDSFKNTFDRIIPRYDSNGETSETKRNIRVIEYFNGVTLDEAVKSTSEIDAAAIKIAGNEQNSRKKALLIYKWITQNVKYDYDKAERISRDTSGISSGSKVAFETRKGICFDYSCLYVSMCRAVGLKVRLITGIGYSGLSWGDHAWNQVYSTEENRWINVDATFGTTANYFDKQDFGVDHKYAEIQGEW